MNTFHFTYFLNGDQNISKGVNIEAESMIEAIATFNLDFDGIEPINVVNKDLFSNNQIEETEKQMQQ